MRIRPYRFWIFIAAGFLVLTLILFTILGVLSPKPPYIEVSRARESISETRISKAQYYAPQKYSEVIGLYDTIMEKWKKQNELFFLKRDFTEISVLAEKVILMSEIIKSESDKTATNLEVLLIRDLEEKRRQISRYDSIFNIIPLSEQCIEKYTQGKLLYIESLSAFGNNHFNMAFQKLQTASQLCNEVIDSINIRLANYFNNYDYWIKLAGEAITWSVKRKDHVIIVDKFAKSCQVYYAGKLKYDFEIELGPNWIGDKRHKGDNATPEGKYLVSKKLGGKETKYYKALLINYPNEDDKKRFTEEIKNGTLPGNTDIGGLIELHGDGGKGFHWTNGCIALKNEDMDKVFKVTAVGTRVIIIGSMKNISDLFNLE